MNIDKQTLNAWTEALESGEYVQGSGCLRYDSYDGDTLVGSQFCCLGVLADIMGIEFDTADEEGHEDNADAYDDFSRALHGVHINSVDLIEMNDEGETSFVEISNFIKEETKCVSS
jgi:hypothetical protein